jgi:hypothetical protein
LNSSVERFEKLRRTGREKPEADYRRVEIRKWKKQSIMPLEYAQWGDMLAELEKEKELINHWTRPKPLKEAAYRYYAHAILEIDSFNEIWRKHISHARNTLYQPDVAISCWDRVYRFMDSLAEYMLEDERTPLVWSKMIS